MDNNTVRGEADSMVGRAKKAAGELAGNPGLKVKGQLQEASGNIQSFYGRTLDSVRAYTLREPLRALVIAAAAGMVLMQWKIRNRER
ncbi:CsbD family protein [Pinirhizobacter soli]|uniref:CsbD family protein n=1 Tax=Pinirhizobacter soli TaxID=2786953 RepID=UPI00202ABC3F|nr:CsbD family protein [Pinirhizobacter soli]